MSDRGKDGAVSPLVRSTRVRILALLADRAAGHRCPSEPELAARCGVSRTTVRAALRLLEKEGTVCRDGRWRHVARRVRGEDLAGEPVAVETKEQLVTRYLTGLTGVGRLSPGQHVSEREVACRLGVSIGPVREAFLALAPLGLFRKESRQRWRVATLDDRQIEEMMEMRLLIEDHCLVKFFRGRAPGGALADLRRIGRVARRYSELSGITVDQFLGHDVAFHQWILGCGDNGLLVERSRFIYAIIDLQLRNPGFGGKRVRLGLDQHLAIIQALEEGDEAGARKRLAAHMDSAAETLRMLIRTDRGGSDGNPGRR